MTWDITDRFPDWGETGESPPTGFFYEGGDQVNEKHLDYLWNSVKGLEDDVQAALDDIDNDSDGKVDAAESADTATLVKGKDIDSNGDGIVDKADEVVNRYTDSEAVSAVDGEVDNAATTVASLDDAVAGKVEQSGGIDNFSNIELLGSGDTSVSSNGQVVVVDFFDASPSDIIIGNAHVEFEAGDTNSVYGFTNTADFSGVDGLIGWGITGSGIDGSSDLRIAIFNDDDDASHEIHYAFWKITP